VIVFQVFPSRFKIAAEEECCDKSGRHHFRTAHSALHILVMMQGFQTIVTETVNGYNTFVHEFPQRLGFGHH
jgi:hypothetical protein